MRKSNSTWIQTWVIVASLTLFDLAFVFQSGFGEIVVDGDISDAEWKNAQEFVFSLEDPKFDVTALVRRDETYLYFACVSTDPVVQGVHEQSIQEVWKDDSVQYYLETDNEKFEGRSENSYQLINIASFCQFLRLGLRGAA